MFEQEDGRVAGSIDRARVAELLAATKDEELQDYYRELLGESEEGQAVDEPAEAESDSDEAADVEPETEDAPPVEDDLDALRAQAEELGIKVDGRWGADRLREEIAAYQPEGEDG